MNETQEALKALVDHVERETCQHDNRHRGGLIWTICDDCGRKWADDEGGFKPYEPHPALAKAKALLSRAEGARETSCFECGHDLNGPYCPACNPLQAEGAPAAEGAQQRLLRALEIWHLAHETGRNEPLQVARDHGRRLVASLVLAALSPPAAEGKEDLRDALHNALCGYGLTNMSESDDPSRPFPLIDLCSNPGTTVETGREELFFLADHLVSHPRVLAALSHTPAPAAEPVGDPVFDAAWELVAALANSGIPKIPRVASAFKAAREALLSRLQAERT